MCIFENFLIETIDESGKAAALGPDVLSYYLLNN